MPIPLRDQLKEILHIARELDPETDPTADPDLNPSWHYRHSPKVCWLMSIENHEKNSFPGRVTEANPYVAAECIYYQTHRSATDAEIEAEQQRRENMRLLILEMEAASKNSMSPQKLIETVVAAVTATQGQSLSQNQMIEALTVAIQNANAGGPKKPAGKERGNEQ